jgi:hypothetical protein
MPWSTASPVRSRRYGRGCDQPITQAEPLEEQLIDSVAAFRPDEELRVGVLASIRSAARHSGVKTERPRERCAAT